MYRDQQDERHAAIASTIEPSCKDEARVGQKNGITRRWARRGTRPSAPKDQRTASAYIYGAICPAEGKGAALVLPRCNTQGMSLHLAEMPGMGQPIRGPCGPEDVGDLDGGAHPASAAGCSPIGDHQLVERTGHRTHRLGCHLGIKGGGVELGVPEQRLDDTDTVITRGQTFSNGYQSL
jgi:hypothetical protein